jgi:hypothetical protein
MKELKKKLGLCLEEEQYVSLFRKHKKIFVSTSWNLQVLLCVKLAVHVGNSDYLTQIQFMSLIRMFL